MESMNQLTKMAVDQSRNRFQSIRDQIFGAASSAATLFYFTF
jgi:hypothetical protein